MRISAVTLSFILLSMLAPGAAPAQSNAPSGDRGFELGERLGVDDGYALVIETSGDIQGDLGPCG